MRIRIQLFTLMRIRIKLLNNADPWKISLHNARRWLGVRRSTGRLRRWPRRRSCASGRTTRPPPPPSAKRLATVPSVWQDLNFREIQTKYRRKMRTLLVQLFNCLNLFCPFYGFFTNEICFIFLKKKSKSDMYSGFATLGLFTLTANTACVICCVRYAYR